MGTCEASKAIVSENIGHKLYFLAQNCDKSGAAHDLCTDSVGVKIGMQVSLEELDITSDYESDDMPVEELGISLSRVLQIPEDPILDGSCDENELQSPSVELNLSEGFEFSKLEEERLHPETLTDTGGLLSNASASSRSPKYHATPNLVSAMKGSRAKHGIVSNSKLSVKWAPDVYDPPVTSESHTLKGHRHRHKAVKRDYYCKSKHSKARIPRKNDRKHSHSSSGSGKIIDPQLMRSQATREKAALHELSTSKAGSAEELKWGSSSCCMEPRPPLHLSVAEAS